MLTGNWVSLQAGEEGTGALKLKQAASREHSGSLYLGSGVNVAQIPLQICKRLFCFCLRCADGKLFSKLRNNDCEVTF